MPLAIRVDNLSKQYQLGERAGLGDRTMCEVISDASAKAWRRLTGKVANPLGGAARGTTFDALRDVSLSIDHGEIVGIVGRNGAGKSTLLKILTRITQPSRGRVELHGRVGSLLEVGTGFHPELSGRDNVFLNGAILGMSRREIKTKFDEIVAFAEIEQFLETPVKRYSSGMYVRLAFAVAAHLEPEILLVDEVLAVGDSAFQRKCLGKMGDVAQQGRTILFVSHNMAAITRLCTRGIWLERGRLRAEGHIENVVSSYLAEDSGVDGEVVFRDRAGAPGDDVVRLEAVRVVNHEEVVAANLDARRPFQIDVQYRLLKPTSDLRLGVRLLTHDGTPIFSTTDADGCDERIERFPGSYVSRCTVPGNFLNFGQYFITVGCDTPLRHVHFLLDPALSIRLEATGGVGAHISDGRQGILRLTLPWDVRRAPSCVVPSDDVVEAVCE